MPSGAIYTHELPGNITSDTKKTFIYTYPGGLIRDATMSIRFGPANPGYPITILPAPGGGAWYDCPNGGRYFLDWLPWGVGYRPPGPDEPDPTPTPTPDPEPDEPDPTPPDEPPITPIDPDPEPDPDEDEKDFMRQEWEYVDIGYDKDGNHVLKRTLITQWYEKVATL